MTAGKGQTLMRVDVEIGITQDLSIRELSDREKVESKLMKSGCVYTYVYGDKHK